jgi:hypothetical protein
MRRFDNSFLDLVQRRSTLQLFLIWIGTILLSGCCYWLGALIGDHGLLEGGRPVGADLKGFASAVYFSFVTATSIGYGDIVPVGGARAIALPRLSRDCLFLERSSPSSSRIGRKSW